MSFPQKVKSALWAIVDAMACNTAQFVKNPGPLCFCIPPTTGKAPPGDFPAHPPAV